MKKVILALSLSAVAFAQDIAISGESAFKPVTVSFTYILPADDPLVKAAKNDGAMEPAKIVWLWGDEELGAKKKNFTEYAWDKGQKVSHTYAKPGTFGVYAVVTDQKGRLIKQSSVSVKIQELVKVEQ